MIEFCIVRSFVPKQFSQILCCACVIAFFYLLFFMTLGLIKAASPARTFCSCYTKVPGKVI